MDREFVTDDEIINGQMMLEEFQTLPKRVQEIIFASIICETRYDNPLSGVEIFFIQELLNYSQCKSPIETIFQVAYDIFLYDVGFPECEIFFLRPQKEIQINDKKYYADFLIDTEGVKGIYRKNPCKLVIECDGHEFHEKTKEQVEQRNKRDLDLMTAGYEVLHFSGSQIYKNPFRCAEQTYKFLISKVGEVEFKGVGFVNK